MSESEGEPQAPVVTVAGFGPEPENAAEPVGAGVETDPEFQLFVGTNLGKFLLPPERGGWRARPCWPGFFFPQAWFLYRKLYGWAALCCVLPILSAALDLGLFGRGLVAATSVIGIAGRRLYVAAARRAIARIRAAGGDEQETLATIQRAGGVSIAGAVVGGGIVVGANITAFLVSIHVLTLPSP